MNDTQINNGNPYIFCDQVTMIEGGYHPCVRGAGHNGGHLYYVDHLMPLSPVALPSNRRPTPQQHGQVGRYDASMMGYKCECGGRWQKYGKEFVHKEPGQ